VVSIPAGAIRRTSERRSQQPPPWTAHPSPEELSPMFTIEEESGTFTGTLRQHNGYYAGDFSRMPMRTAHELSALANLRPPSVMATPGRT
jgi:hypothetical protein